ncbi:MAG TPA: hypothetical protein VFS43_20875 [Polyangiaceae bacterium]|nr:hypothetical protein [Polyangiaceae bacterium]
MQVRLDSVGDCAEVFVALERKGCWGTVKARLTPDLADAFTTLRSAERPKVPTLGIDITLLSTALMQWLARAKRRTAVALGSRAMEADAIQTMACF